MPRFLLTILLVLLPLQFSGCFLDCWFDDCSVCDDCYIPEPPREFLPMDASHLKMFADCSEMKEWLAGTLAEQLLSQQYYGSAMMEDAEMASIDSGAVRTSLDSAEAQPEEVSQTNVQEEGVDEPDLVKAGQDGTLYVMRGNVLKIIDAFPATSMAVLSSLELPVDGAQMMLDEERKVLIVIGRVPYDYGDAKGDEDIEILLANPWLNEWSQTVVVIVSIENPKTPVVKNTVSVDGWELDARRIDGKVYLVTSPELLVQQQLWQDETLGYLLEQYNYSKAVARGYGSGEEMPADSVAVDSTETFSPGWQALDVGVAEGDDSTWAQRIRSRVYALINAAPLADQMPGVMNSTGVLQKMTCNQVYHTPAMSDPGLVMVTEIDSSDDTLVTRGIAHSAHLIYAFTDTLYLAQSSGDWWWWNRSDSMTSLFRFDLGDGIEYRAGGSVPGWVNDRFSLSEYKGDLRVVTTTPASMEEEESEQANHVFVLRPDSKGTLETIGSVENLAPGERVYSARFVGSQGYVVTFRQVDPLFVIDFSNPVSPEVTGQLKIPGFSEYMHPITEGFLLTVGRDANDSGQVAGLALQLFDVRDPSAPTLVDKWIAPGYWSYSDASYDPHAFTWLPSEQLFAIPLAWFDDSTSDYYAGISAFRIDTITGIESLGGTNHNKLASQFFCTQNDYCYPQSYYWYGTPNRSVFMKATEQTYLYTISSLGLVASSVETPQQSVGELLLPEPWLTEQEWIRY